MNVVFHGRELEKWIVNKFNDLIYCYGVMVKPRSMKTEESCRTYSSGSQSVTNGPAGGHAGCQKGHKKMTKN